MNYHNSQSPEIQNVSSELNQLNFLIDIFAQYVPLDINHYDKVRCQLYDTFGSGFHSMLEKTFTSMGANHFFVFVHENIPHDISKRCYEQNCQSIYESLKSQEFKRMIDFMFGLAYTIIKNNNPQLQLNYDFSMKCVSVILSSFLLFYKMKQTNANMHISPFPEGKFSESANKYVSLNKSKGVLQLFPVKYGIFDLSNKNFAFQPAIVNSKSTPTFAKKNKHYSREKTKKNQSRHGAF